MTRSRMCCRSCLGEGRCGGRWGGVVVTLVKMGDVVVFEPAG